MVKLENYQPIMLINIDWAVKNSQINEEGVINIKTRDWENDQYRVLSVYERPHQAMLVFLYFCLAI